MEKKNMKVNWKKVKEFLFGYDDYNEDDNVTCVGAVPTVLVLAFLTFAVLAPLFLL